MRRVKKAATNDYVEIDINLGRTLKAEITKAARRSNISLNEYIVNAVESAVRQPRHGLSESERFTPHGGKHLQGKSCGYEKTEDGRYYAAPTYRDSFEQLFAERSAVHALVNAVMDHAQERLVQCEQRIQKLKGRIVDDIGLDPEKVWVYYGGDGRGYLKEVEPESQNDGRE